MVEAVDPSERGHFQILHIAPRPLAVDQLRFVEAVYGFSEGVVIRVANNADRWLNASFSQTLVVSNGQILPAHCLGRALFNNVLKGAIRMMNQSALLDRPSFMQGLFQGIENKNCLGRPRDPPSNNAISECVDDEGYLDKALPC